MFTIKIKRKYLLVGLLAFSFFTVILIFLNNSNLTTLNQVLPDLLAPEKTYVFLDGWNEEIIENYIDNEKTLPRYLELINNEKNPTLQNQAKFQLGRFYYQLRNFSEAAIYLNQVVTATDFKLAESAIEMLLSILYNNEKIDEAKALLSNFQRNFASNISMISEIWDKFLSKNHNTLSDFEQKIHQMEDGEEKDQLFSKYSILSWRLEHGNCVISGKVFEAETKKPLAGIPVYLLQGKGANQIHALPYLPMTFTDSQGNFKFSNLAPGVYNVGIELIQDKFSGSVTITSLNEDLIKLTNENSKRIVNFRIRPGIKILSPTIGARYGQESEGLVKFQWEKVENAKYYIVSISPYYENSIYYSSYGFKKHIVEKLTAPSLEIDFKKEDNNFSALEYSSNIIKPQFIIGWIYPGSKIVWRVQAYDEKDYVIADSFNLIEPDKKNYFTFNYGELSPGDAKVVEGKYIESIKLYMSELTQNIDNLQSLDKIIRLLEYLAFSNGSPKFDFMTLADGALTEGYVTEKVIRRIRENRNSYKLWSSTIFSFLIHGEIKEKPLIWEDFFDPILLSSDQNELEQIRSEILENRFRAEINEVQGATLIRQICGFFYKFMTDYNYYSVPKSSEYYKYIQMILVNSGKWHDNLLKFFDVINTLNDV